MREYTRPSETPTGVSVEDQKRQAELEIGAICHEVAVMGANDSEIPAINALLESMRADTLAPQEAIRLSAEIRDRKGAYH